MKAGEIRSLMANGFPHVPDDIDVMVDIGDGKKVPIFNVCRDYHREGDAPAKKDKDGCVILIELKKAEKKKSVVLKYVKGLLEHLEDTSYKWEVIQADQTIRVFYDTPEELFTLGLSLGLKTGFAK